MPNMTDPKIFESVVVETNYTAMYKRIDFTVTWKNWDGSILKIEVVGIHSTATPPTNPTKSGYTFTGWLPANYTDVTSNLEIVAQFKEIVKETFKVIWNGKDGSPLKTETVESGESATPPTVPEVAGYRFDKWDTTYNEITSNVTITAVYVKVWTVTWVGYENEQLKVEVVDDNTAATPPSIPEVSGKAFKSWSSDYSKITSDITITATYENTELKLYYEQKFASDEICKTYIVDGESIVVKAYPFKTTDYQFNSLPNQKGNEVKIHLEHLGKEIPYSDYTITLSNTDYFKVSNGLITRVLNSGMQDGEKRQTTVTVTYNGTVKTFIVESFAFKLMIGADWSDSGSKVPIYIYDATAPSSLKKLNLLEEDYSNVFMSFYSYNNLVKIEHIMSLETSTTEFLSGPLMYYAVNITDGATDVMQGRFTYNQNTNDFKIAKAAVFEALNYRRGEENWLRYSG